MRAKLIYLLLSLAFSYFNVTGSSRTDITVQNATFLSNSNNNYYYGFNNGDTVRLSAKIFFVDGYYIVNGPADSVYWFFNGVPLDTTYGTESIRTIQPGSYSAIGYYTFIPLTSHTVILNLCSGGCSAVQTSITGPATPACNTASTYSASNPFSAGSSFAWTVPYGATITSGQGTSTVQIRFAQGFLNGIVSVRVQNSCCISNGSLSVQGLLPTPGQIVGSQSVCARQRNVSYFVPPVSGATSYTWVVPYQASIVAGAGTNSIRVNFGRTAGTISVHANNSCGSSPNRSIAVSFVCRESAELEEETFQGITIYPNPTANQFILKTNSSEKFRTSFVIRDLSGRMIQQWDNISEEYFYFGENLPSGFYYGELIQGNESKLVRLIKSE